MNRHLLGLALLALSCGPEDLPDADVPDGDDPSPITSSSSFEAEAMTGSGTITADSTASGGQFRKLWRAGAATVALNTGTAATGLSLKVRGQPCNGAPQVQVKIDGVALPAREVTQTAWTSLFFSKPVPSGTHTIEVAFTNDAYVAGSCDRNLDVDRGNLTNSPPPLTTKEDFYATETEPWVDSRTRQPVKMTGLSLQPIWSLSGTSTLEQARYDDIASHGFKVLRFVLFWDYMEPSRGQFNATTFGVLDTAIARAKKAGLHVVIDAIHLYGSPGGMSRVPTWARPSGSGDSVDVINAHAKPYLQYLANRYKTEPAVAAYDFVNEPYVWPIDNDKVLSMYDGLIKAVRTIDPDKIVHIEGGYGTSNLGPGCADFSKLTVRENVVIQYHDYFAGGDDDGFASSGCGTAGHYTWNGGAYTGSRAELDAHAAKLDAISRYARLPIWIGELGLGDSIGGHDAWIHDKVSVLKAHGYSYCWWEYHVSNGGGMSATRGDYSWKPLVAWLF